MKGTNQLILNDQTVMEIIQDWLKNNFIDKSLKITAVDYTSYNKEWKFTIEGELITDKEETDESK